MQVRPVAPDDFDRWLPLWDGYNAFYGRHGDTALPRHITDVLWERFFDDGEPVHGLVAVDGERLVGLTHYLFHRSTTQVSLACYLQDLYTSADARRQGVGRALIEAVYTAADQTGAGRVYWHTQTSNEPGRRLYDKVAHLTDFLMYAR